MHQKKLQQRSEIPMKEKRKLNGYSVMKSKIISSLLNQRIKPSNILEKMILSRYTNRLTYILSSLSHDDYDPLTPDNHLESCQALIFVFQKDHFTLTLRNPLDGRIPEYRFKYNSNISEVLESLETGIITPSLFRLTEKMYFNGWYNGSILAIIEDHRYSISSAKTMTVNLKLGSEVMAYDAHRAIGSETPERQIEYERQTLLVKHPVICTDPNPCVARFMSGMDWRNKMWYLPRETEKPRKSHRKAFPPKRKNPTEIPRFSMDMLSPYSGFVMRPDLGDLILQIEEEITK